jgi:hypothetical protein
MWLALVAMAISAMVSAYGAYKSGQAQKEAAEFNSKVQEQNASAAKEKAAYDEQQQRYKARLLMSTQIARYAASGGDISEGTPLDVVAEQAFQSEKDSIAIKYGGDVSSSRYLSAAEGERFQGQNSAAAGNISAVGSILKGASSVAGAYQDSGSTGYKPMTINKTGSNWSGGM